jgi:hypothetical protein
VYPRIPGVQIHFRADRTYSQKSAAIDSLIWPDGSLNMNLISDFKFDLSFRAFHGHYLQTRQVFKAGGPSCERHDRVGPLFMLSSTTTPMLRLETPIRPYIIVQKTLKL